MRNQGIVLGAGVGACEGIDEGNIVGKDECKGEGRDGSLMATAYVVLLPSNIELVNSTRDISQHSTC